MYLFCIDKFMVFGSTHSHTCETVHLRKQKAINKGKKKRKQKYKRENKLHFRFLLTNENFKYNNQLLEVVGVN